MSNMAPHKRPCDFIEIEPELMILDSDIFTLPMLQSKLKIKRALPGR